MSKQKLLYNLEQIKILRRCSRYLKLFIGKFSKKFSKSNYLKSDLLIKKRKSLHDLIIPVINCGKKLKSSNKIIRQEELTQLQNISSIIFRDAASLKVHHYPRPYSHNNSEKKFKTSYLRKNTIQETRNANTHITSYQNYFVPTTIPGITFHQNSLSLKHHNLHALQHTTKRYYAIKKLKFKSFEGGVLLFNKNLIKQENNKFDNSISCETLDRYITSKILIQKIIPPNDFENKNILSKEDKNSKIVNQSLVKINNVKGQNESNEYFNKKVSTTYQLIKTQNIFKKYDMWNSNVPNFQIYIQMHTTSVKEFPRKFTGEAYKVLGDESTKRRRTVSHNKPMSYDEILKKRIKKKSKILMDQLKTAADMVNPSFIIENNSSNNMNTNKDTIHKKITKKDVIRSRINDCNKNKFNLSINNSKEIPRNVKNLRNTPNKCDQFADKSNKLNRKSGNHEISNRPFSVNSRIWRMNIENLMNPFKNNSELDRKATWKSFIKKYKLQSENLNDLGEYKVTSKLSECIVTKKDNEFINVLVKDNNYIDKSLQTAIKTLKVSQTFRNDDDNDDDNNNNDKKNSNKNKKDIKGLAIRNLELCSLSKHLHNIKKIDICSENEEISDDEQDLDLESKKSLASTENQKCKKSEGRIVTDDNIRKNVEIIYPISKKNYSNMSDFYCHNNNINQKYDTKDRDNLMMKCMKKSLESKILQYLASEKNKSRSEKNPEDKNNTCLTKFCNHYLKLMSKNYDKEIYKENYASDNSSNTTHYSTVIEKIKNEINLRKNKEDMKGMSEQIVSSSDINNGYNFLGMVCVNRHNRGKSCNEGYDDVLSSEYEKPKTKKQKLKSGNLKNTKKTVETANKNNLIKNKILNKIPLNNKSILSDLLNDKNAFLKLLPLINEGIRNSWKFGENNHLNKDNKKIKTIKNKVTDNDNIKGCKNDKIKAAENASNNDSDKSSETLALSNATHEPYENNAYLNSNVEDIVMKDDVIVLNVKVKIPFSSVLMILGKKGISISGKATKDVT